MNILQGSNTFQVIDQDSRGVGFYSALTFSGSEIYIVVDDRFVAFIVIFETGVLLVNPKLVNYSPEHSRNVFQDSWLSVRAELSESPSPLNRMAVR